MLKIIPFLTAAVLALPGPVMAQDAGAVLRIIEAQDQIVRIQAKTRHTTVIVLPASEDILDFVVGDSEYWHLTGAANLAFLKPIAERGHNERGAGLRVRAHLFVPGDGGKRRGTALDCPGGVPAD